MKRLVQLALDFFDASAGARGTAQPPAASPADQRSGSHPSVPGSSGLKPKVPVKRTRKAPPAPKKIATSAPPTAPLPTLLAPAEFRHPQANREVLLGDALVAYALHRSRRRTIGFTVGADGLAVRAPSWVALSAVDTVLRERSAWVMTKLVQARERQQRLESGRIVWADGVQLPYLGQPLQVVLDATQSRSGRGGALHAGASPDTPARLVIGLPADASATQIRDAVLAWLMRDARRHFTERLDHFAPLLGVQWTSLRLSSAETRWGSAKADGSIRLNWRLLHYRPAVIDYVVAHELAHLRVMDHSPRFWNTVATVVPDYAALRNHLREEPAPLW